MISLVLDMHVHLTEESPDAEWVWSHWPGERNGAANKTINHTLKYIPLSEAMYHDENNFTVKVAKTHEEAISLLEAGFNKVDEFDDLHLYRKLK